MIKLIGSKETVEEMLAASGLEEISKTLGITEDLWVYGCGLFHPGRYFDELILHAQDGTLLGVVALWFTEHAVSALDPALRAHLGAVLQLAPSIYVPDQLAACAEKKDGWSLHYAVRAKLGGHPAWCAPHDAAGGLCEQVKNPIPDVGGIICNALLGLPIHVVPPAHGWGSAHNIVNSEPRRFVDFVGLASALDGPVEMAEVAIKTERQRAITTIREMYAAWKERCGSKPASTPAQIWAQIEGALGGVVSGGVSDKPRPRELVLGTTFDPATHYTPEYFGDGAGLLYTRADGSKDVYHGPAHEWDGMRAAAQFLWKLLPRGPTDNKPRLIDIGSGAGCFVGFAKEAGFIARGYDISEAAVASAQAKGRDVHLRNVVTDPPGESAHIVTALDFWEHIYLDDLDQLIEAVKGCMLPSLGKGFFIVCTRTAAEHDWTVSKGDCFTKENSWMLCAGHVTLRTWGWWVNRFQAHGLIVDADLAYRFQVMRDEEVGLQLAESWRPKNLVVVWRGK